MPTEPDRRRVLVAARVTERPALTRLFAADPLASWEAVPADTFERARFALQHTPYDVLLVDEGLCCADDEHALASLVGWCGVPVVCLAGNEAETCARAYERGATICLPRQLTLGHPPLLAAALARATAASEAQRAQLKVREGLLQSRRQIDRLVGLLWRSAPLDPESRWGTQRYMMERLEEELARSRRYGGELTVALGEVGPREGAGEDGFLDWLPLRVGRSKRRCDVAGQYGPRGFMLLMVQTPIAGGVNCCRRLQRELIVAGAEADPALAPRRIAFGLESLSASATTPQAVLSRAEERLDEARAGEGGGVVGG